jgi:hypothetical protein
MLTLRSSQEQSAGDDLVLASATQQYEGVQWTARHTIPALLSVCHESRSETRHLYNYAFGSQLSTPVLFSLTTDVVLFANGFSMEVFFRKNWAKPEEDNNQDLVQLFAVLAEDDGSTSLGEWGMYHFPQSAVCLLLVMFRLMKPIPWSRDCFPRLLTVFLYSERKAARPRRRSV